MKNGGGPACLRLRVALKEAEFTHMHGGVLFEDRLYTDFKTWVHQFYRDRLHPDDLADPQLLGESRAALDALTGLLGLGSVYDFQMA